MIVKQREKKIKSKIQPSIDGEWPWVGVVGVVGVVVVPVVTVVVGFPMTTRQCGVFIR